MNALQSNFEGQIGIDGKSRRDEKGIGGRVSTENGQFGKARVVQLEDCRRIFPRFTNTVGFLKRRKTFKIRPKNGPKNHQMWKKIDNFFAKK